MRLRFLLVLFFVLVLTCGISFASNDFTVAGNTFEVPNGYSFNKTNDNVTNLVNVNDTNYTIFVLAGEMPDAETAKNSREISGFKLLADENYTSENNLTINQQNYIKNESYYSFYTFDINRTSYLIGYTFPVHDDFAEDEGNPVDVIINSV